MANFLATDLPAGRRGTRIYTDFFATKAHEQTQKIQIQRKLIGFSTVNFRVLLCDFVAKELICVNLCNLPAGRQVCGQPIRVIRVICGLFFLIDLFSPQPGLQRSYL